MKRKNNTLLYVILGLVLVVTVGYITYYFTSNIETFTTNNKMVCLYAYYEKDETYKNNLLFFLDNAIIDSVDYYIIINGKSTVNIPKQSNISVIRRDNIGFDFGAYAHVINNVISTHYDYYFFINSSVRGPFYSEQYKDTLWTDIFLQLFNAPDVKLVGTSINIYDADEIQLFNKNYNLSTIFKRNHPFPHVQSMFFCIDNEYLQYLKSIQFFNEREITSQEMSSIIVNKEIGLSILALKKGWNINCLLPSYSGLDYRTITRDINPTSNDGDPYYPNCYFGKSIDKFDVVFFKTNREISSS